MNPLATWRSTAAVVLGTLLIAGMAIGPAAAQGQAWPTKPIRLVAPFPPGSSIDLIARLLAQPMADALGQPIVVENKVGAGGNVGVDSVVKSPPDGYTIGIGARGPLAINPFLVDGMSYDPVKDVAPIAVFGSSAIVLWVRAENPAKTLQEFVAQAKAQPGKFNYASDGIGTTNHLGGEALKSAAKIDLVHVPYKGTAEAMTALLQGDVQIFPGGLPPLVGLYKAGKIRPLATAMTTREPQLPDVPTTGEAGIVGAEMYAWFAMFAPAGTPAEIIAKIRAALKSALDKPEVRDTLVSRGITPQLSTPQEMAKLVLDERAKWGPVIQATKAMKTN
ncbi:MAG: tripartite tricarboxylate transporter substrate binding protein [Burkholderiales bacterium]|nr:tripartite tricarboxylate transporter substrate binding protein [Burkholderiales bacterium]